MGPLPQPVTEPATRDAIFLVLTVNPGDAGRDTVRAVCGDLPGLVRAVGQRDVHGQLSCVAAFGSDAWNRLFGPPRPAELHTLAEIGVALASRSRLRATSSCTSARSAWISASSSRCRSCPVSTAR